MKKLGFLLVMLIASLGFLSGCQSDHTQSNPVVVTEPQPDNQPPIILDGPTANTVIIADNTKIQVWDVSPAYDLKMQASDTDFSDTGHIDKAAVIDGINKYPGAELNGCVNDAKVVAYIHMKYYGFKRENIKLLLDGAATTENIQNGLAWIAAKSHPQAGDFRIFWHSGHGTEDAISADAASEPDHLNQIMCPVDFDWTRQHMIIDKDLVAIFAQMPPDVIFNWGSDSCHSGDLDKNIRPKKVTSKHYPNTPTSVQQRVTAVKKRFNSKKELMHRNLVDGVLNVGYLSGCKPDELSSDTVNDQGLPCGEMTDTWWKTLQNNQDLPLTDLANKMDAIMRPYDQTPQAEGVRKNKPWLK